MKIATFEVRIRLDTSFSDEAKAILSARFELMDIRGVLSVSQVGEVFDPKKEDKADGWAKV